MTAKSTWRERAEALGLTQKRLADILGRDDTAIYRWLRGQGSREGQRELQVLILALELLHHHAGADAIGQWQTAIDLDPALAPVPRKK